MGKLLHFHIFHTIQRIAPIISGAIAPAAFVTNTHYTDTLGCTFYRPQDSYIWIYRRL